MSHKAIVSSWRGAFGFATLEDGTSIYIHTDEIGGGRLRVGREVCFDLEAVEGQEGRHKGVNVSGTAVLPKGEKLSAEEYEEDLRLRGDLRLNNKVRNKTEYDPVKARVDKLNHSNKVFLIRELLKELDIGVLENSKDGGRRYDPTERSRDRKLYTKKEFLYFYGPKNGEVMWAMAAKGGVRGGGGKGQ
eukprot:Rhum_TRINITY_DN14830_c0_g1::Rhum_TRINITY_DN14830_c0_g1_i2::g.120913::m.120913